MLSRGGIDQKRDKRCRRAGRDMANTSPKFGGWRLCATCGRESEVKATENKKWMVTEKRKKNGKKKGLEKQIGQDGSRGDRPFDLFQLSLKAALWTIGTSGKTLYFCKRISLASYRNLVPQKCAQSAKNGTANCTAVLL